MEQHGATSLQKPKQPERTTGGWAAACRAARWVGPLLAVSLAVLAVAAVSARQQPVGPVTALHYAPNANFGPGGTYLPAKVGFNLADVSSPGQLAFLPPGVQALVWIGQCDGVTEKFLRSVRPYADRTQVFGFYLMDDPDPRLRPTLKGFRRPCPQEHLTAESDWIHAHMPGARTFIVMMNLATPGNPSFSGGYDLRRLHVDLVGVDPYPCRSELKTCDLDMIDRYVAAAEAEGLPARRIVPVYQSFGGGQWLDGNGGVYAAPSRQQEEQILARWRKQVPHPAFDYAYSWGSQKQDRAIENSSDLRAVFAHHNADRAAYRVSAAGSGPSMQRLSRGCVAGEHPRC